MNGASSALGKSSSGIATLGDPAKVGMRRAFTEADADVMDVGAVGTAGKHDDISPDGLIPNLLAFNVGVEIGQLLALGAILIVMGYWRRTASFWRHAYTANVAMMCSSLANLSASDSSTLAAAAASCSANLARFSFDFFLEIGFPFAAFFASLLAFASACVESNFKRPSILGVSWSQ